MHDRIKNKLRIILVTLLYVMIVPAAGADPDIEITGVPPYGVDGIISGAVSGVDPADYKA